VDGTEGPPTHKHCIMSRRFSHRQIERWLARILMSGLIINLHLLPAHPLALADDPQPREPWCLPVPIPPEMQQLIDTQQAIHAGVFVNTYDVCYDVALILDEEITEAPSVVSGRNALDEAFTLDVSVVERVDDWSDVGGLTQEQIHELNDVQGAGVLIVGDMAGPVGTQRIAAFTLSMNFDNLGRVNLLLPIYAFSYRVPGEMAILCGSGNPEFELCMGNALGDYNTCVAMAKNDLKTCVESNGLARALAGGLLGCLVGLRGVAAGPLIGLITAVAGCLAGAAAGLLTAIAQCVIEFDGEMTNCELQYTNAVDACCREFWARQAQAQP